MLAGSSQAMACGGNTYRVNIPPKLNPTRTLCLWPRPDGCANARYTPVAKVGHNSTVRILNPIAQVGPTVNAGPRKFVLLEVFPSPGTNQQIVRGWLRADFLVPLGTNGSGAATSTTISGPAVLVMNASSNTLRLLIEEDNHTVYQQATVEQSHASRTKGPFKIGIDAAGLGGVNFERGSNQSVGNSTTRVFQGQQRNAPGDITVPPGTSEQVPVPVRAVRSGAGIFIQVDVIVPWQGARRIVPVDRRQCFAGSRYEVNDAKIRAAVERMEAETAGAYGAY